LNKVGGEGTVDKNKVAPLPAVELLDVPTLLVALTDAKML
jgi:hypothetical protein